MKPRRLTKARRRTDRRVSRIVRTHQDSHMWAAITSRLICMGREWSARVTTYNFASPGRRMRYAKQYRDRARKP